jgi:hypothetical protein
LPVTGGTRHAAAAGWRGKVTIILTVSIAAGTALAAYNGFQHPADRHEDPSAGPFQRWYDDTSVWNQPIPPQPQLEPASDLLVEGLVTARDERGFVIGVSEWTIPVYYADTKTPRVDVAVAGRPPGAHYDRTFVHGVRSVLKDVPMPPNATPDPLTDAHLTIVDATTGCEYDLYGARHTEVGWTAEWANAIPLDGDGIYPHGLSSRASGFAPLARGFHVRP